MVCFAAVPFTVSFDAPEISKSSNSVSSKISTRDAPDVLMFISFSLRMCTAEMRSTADENSGK